MLFHARCMAFRADESAKHGREEAVNELITRYLPNRSKSEAVLGALIDEYGPVVQSYPRWHPLVSSSPNPSKRIWTLNIPEVQTGFKGLDHTIYLRNGFITCPYSNGQTVLDSVDKLKCSPGVSINAERINVPLYMPEATPILVKCEWDHPMESDGTIPKSLAVPLMLETEASCWRDYEVAETWETMRPYILGGPRGSRSSLFVNQETGQVLKNLWNTLISTGMFGPIYVG
ncbi:MAG: hypothetical protein OJI67_12400 [Prosthecobacter sp.]|nr:hypothetical protein [Prosthecobacter sp.]